MHPCNQHTHLYTLLRIQAIFSSARLAWHSRDCLQLPQYYKTLRNPTQQTTHSPISLIQSHDKLYIDLLWYTCGYRLEFVCKADCKTRQQSQVIWWALEYHDGIFREHQPIESRKIPVRRYLWIRHVKLQWVMLKSLPKLDRFEIIDGNDMRIQTWTWPTTPVLDKT